MERYEKPVMEVISLEEEIKAGGVPGLPCLGQSGNQDAGSSNNP